MAVVAQIILFLIRIFTSFFYTTFVLMIMLLTRSKTLPSVIYIWIDSIWVVLLERIDNSRRFLFYFFDPIVHDFLLRLSLSHVRSIITYILNGDN